MTHIRRASALSCSTLLLALTLTACGGGGGGGGGGSSPATATPTGSTNPAGEPSTPTSPATPGGAASTPTTTTPDTPAPAASSVDVPAPADPGTGTGAGTGTGTGTGGTGTGTGTGGTQTDPGSTVTCTPGDAPAARSAAFSLVNVVRTALQLPLFARVPALDATAQSHAQYVVANGTGGSGEVSTLPCYTGDTLTQRVTAAGVVAAEIPGVRSNTESVLSFDAPVGSELQTWDVVNSALDNVYGRILLLNPFAQYVGVGFSAMPGTQRRAMVFDTTLSAEAAAAASAGLNTWVVWPRDGATGLPARMTPSNLKPLDAAFTEGYPVSLHATAAVQVTRFVLTNASNGAPVTATVVTNANDRNAFLGQSEIALVPHAPLTSGATYRAEFDGLVGTQAVHQSWSFTVR